MCVLSVYFTGGSSGRSDVRVITLDSNNTLTAPSLNQGRQAHSIVQFFSSIVVCGGYDASSSVISTCETLNLNSSGIWEGGWLLSASLPQALADGCLVVINNMVRCFSAGVNHTHHFYRSIILAGIAHNYRL